MNFFSLYSMERIITGLIAAAVIGLAIYFQGYVLLAIVLMTSAITLWEFYSFFWGNKGRVLTRLCGIALGSGMLILTWMGRPQDALVFLGAAFVLTALCFLFRIDIIDEKDNFTPGGIFLAGLAYVPLLLLPATYLSSTKLFFIIFLIVISDTCAYFVGLRYGKHKLWARVSPKKSAEGAVASFTACILSSIILGICLGVASWWHFALLGMLINFFAQVGDLFESSLKRAADIKDSGKLLPGHGGFLDRIDSALFAMPVFAVVDQWFKFF